jgi:hypothetical protein
MVFIWKWKFEEASGLKRPITHFLSIYQGRCQQCLSELVQCPLLWENFPNFLCEWLFLSSTMPLYMTECSVLVHKSTSPVSCTKQKPYLLYFIHLWANKASASYNSFIYSLQRVLIVGKVLHFVNVLHISCMFHIRLSMSSPTHTMQTFFLSFL